MGLDFALSGSVGWRVRGIEGRTIDCHRFENRQYKVRKVKACRAEGGHPSFHVIKNTSISASMFDLMSERFENLNIRELAIQIPVQTPKITDYKSCCYKQVKKHAGPSNLIFSM